MVGRKMCEVKSSTASKYEDQIREIIARDDKNEFASVLSNSTRVKSGDFVKLEFGGSQLCPEKLFRWIFYYRAVNCCAVLVEGNECCTVEFDIQRYIGAFLLHEAAYSLSAPLVELFLSRGADANVRYNGGNLCHIGLLPLHIALERVSSGKDLSQWTPKQSFFKLIIMLCLPQMREALETTRLLVQNTKEFDDVICYYAKEGKLVQLTTLLMVAREKVMGPMTFYSVEDFPSEKTMNFPESVKNELAALIDLEYSIMGRKEEKKLLQLCKEKKMTMIYILQLLGIFERAGCAIEDYLRSAGAELLKEQVAKDVARLLKPEGFTLSSKDTNLSKIADSSTELGLLEQSVDPLQEEKEQSEEPAAECGSKWQDARMPPYSQRGHYFNFHATHDLHKELRNFIWARFRREPSLLSSPVGSCRAFCTSKVSYSSCRRQTIQVQMEERTIGVKQHAQRFPASKQLPSLILGFKRGARCL